MLSNWYLLIFTYDCYLNQSGAIKFIWNVETDHGFLSSSITCLCSLQVTSTLTGLITVEDVVYENVDGNVSHLVPSKALLFRRLTFQRAEGLVQSEALLTREGGTQKIVSETERKKSVSSSKSRKKGNQKKIDSLAIHGNGLCFCCPFLPS